ncbi:MAG: insulinase family protein [Planctomycetes bacterium]|nr:insulinase family protein [Planctomycetota bacterium]
MQRQSIAVASLSCLLAACASSASGESLEVSTREASSPRDGKQSIAAQVDIPFTKFVLPNGLTLIVHEDHKAPIVAVNVWYHVGSKNEKPGKTGFAHLFEHLMFQGSENLQGEFFEPLEKVGATGMNGTTNNDRTNYFETVPKNALDLALMLESDRMGHLLGAIDQAKLDEQRGVVQNEKRQGENQPYGQSQNLIAAGTVPFGHPYSWNVIGSMEDLNAASLEDVKEWFKSSYGAANAVLVIAGDVDANAVKAKVETYFGDIPSGPPITRPKAWVGPMVGTKRQIMQDRVGQPRISMVWNVAPWGDPSLEQLSLFADILAGGKTSRLYQRLVVKEQLATDCRAGLNRRELGSSFSLSATAKPDADLARVEAILDEELARLCKEGPSADELERARTQQLAQFVRGLERIGGFSGKSDQLAEGEVYGDDPAFFKRRIATFERATASDLQRAGTAATQANGRFILTVVPFPAYQVAATGADRSALPDSGTFAEASFPEFERGQLSNGLEIFLVERRAVPTIEMQLLVECGSAADPAGLSGLASMTMNLLDEGTKSKTAVEIGEIQERLGARLGAGAGDDTATLSLSTLKANLGASLDLFADVLLNPSFPSSDFERIRKETLVRMQSSKLEPNAMAGRVLPPLLYGAGHPYGALGGGNGTEATLAALTTKALADYHARWFKPGNAKLLIVGDTSLAELQPLLEQKLAAWKRGEVPARKIGPAQEIAEPLVFLLDRPQAMQSVLQVALTTSPTGDPHDLAIDAMNAFLGGTFTSRINMNLREDKHWSYGARSGIRDAQGPRAFVMSAGVQTDKTKESLLEMKKELADVIGARPGTQAELDQVKAQQTLSLPGRWETNNAVLGSLAELVQYGLRDDHWNTFSGKVRALTTDDVNAAAKQIIDPARCIWIVVGDRAKIEAGVREAGLGEVIVIDADGERVDAGM